MNGAGGGGTNSGITDKVEEGPDAAVVGGNKVGGNKVGGTGGGGRGSSIAGATVVLGMAMPSAVDDAVFVLT